MAQADLARPGLQGVVNDIAAAAVNKLARQGSKIAAGNTAIDAGMKEASDRADAAMEAASLGMWVGIAQGLAQVSSGAAAFAGGTAALPGTRAPDLAARVRMALTWLLDGRGAHDPPSYVTQWVRTGPQVHLVREFDPGASLAFRNFAYLLTQAEQTLTRLLARLPVSPPVRFDVERLLRSLRRTGGYLNRCL